MKSLVKSTCQALLEEVPRLADRYVRHEGDFGADVSVWLARGERELGQLRLPTASQLGVARTRIAAVADGLAPEEAGAKQPSKRKAERLVARAALAEVEELLRHEVQRIDETFDDLRAKLAQGVAMAHAHAALAFPVTEPRGAWLETAWKQCRASNGVSALFLTLEAALRPMDRQNLMDDVVRNMEDSA